MDGKVILMRSCIFQQWCSNQIKQGMCENGFTAAWLRTPDAQAASELEATQSRSHAATPMLWSSACSVSPPLIGLSVVTASGSSICTVID